MSYERLQTEYLDQLAAKGYSDGTLNWRGSHLKHFLAYLRDREITDIKAVNSSHIEAYRLYLRNYRTRQGKSLSARTYDAHNITLTDFFKWLEDTKEILISPVLYDPFPRSKPLHLPTVLTETEVLKVLEACLINTPNGLRDRAILELIYSTGIRRAELVKLDLEDFLPEQEELIIKQGKGKKDRIVPVGEYARIFIRAYLQMIRPWQAKSPEEKALFINGKTGTRINLPNINYLVGQAVKRAKIGKKATPHVFRHSMATHLLRGKADIRHIQAILGHTSLQSTEVYTHLTIEDLKEAVKKAHPRAKRPVKKDDSGSTKAP